VLGTSGNFSALVEREPLRFVITQSGTSKGGLRDDQFIAVDRSLNGPPGSARPSAEAALHVAIYENLREAGAILHTHSVWGTLLSARTKDALTLEGFEMLKGLSGVSTHQHQEIIPVLENTQDYAPLAEQISGILRRGNGVHGFLLRQHGLYTWGTDVSEARRHVEVFEFLFEVLGRSRREEL
jgi:methylthioribulose-1-phosphate dehydratase